MKYIVKHGEQAPTIEDLDDKQLGYSSKEKSLYIRDTDEIISVSGTTMSSSVPIGTILAYAGSTAPDDFLVCDGSTFDETIYPKLKEVLGSATVPDLRNRFIEGKGSSEKVLAKKNAGLPNITGYLDGDTNVNNNGVYWQMTGGALNTTSYNGGHGSGIASYAEASHNSWYNRLSFNASWSNAIYGRSSTVQPASVLVLFIIKAK